MSDLLASLDDDQPDDDATEQPERQNLYNNVFEFIGFLAQVYATDVRDQRTDFRWCSQWYHHTEAIARLEACWKAFEVLRLDPGTGASTWFRDHADPCMMALTATRGPFAQCTATRHKTPDQLPLIPPPAGLFSPQAKTHSTEEANSRANDTGSQISRSDLRAGSRPYRLV